jgi:hypothetical protein
MARVAGGRHQDEGAGHRSQRPVECQLPEERGRAQVGVELAGGRQQADPDREVVRGAILREVGRGGPPSWRYGGRVRWGAPSRLSVRASYRR